jgi:hypothetical protein
VLPVLIQRGQPRLDPGLGVRVGAPGQRVLPVVDLADEALIENADVRRGVGRPGDGVVVTVTLFSGSRGRVLGTVTAAAGQGRARTGR